MSSIFADPLCSDILIISDMTAISPEFNEGSFKRVHECAVISHQIHHFCVHYFLNHEKSKIAQNPPRNVEFSILVPDAEL